MNRLFKSSVVAVSLVFTAISFAQSNEVQSSGPALKFKTGNDPVKSDSQKTLNFFKADPATSKTVPEASAAPVTYDAPEDEGFRTYIGYPKHILSIVDGFNSLTAKWAYNGQDFNFTNSVVEYGLNYTFQATPQWRLSAEYSRYGVKVPAGTASGYVVNSSEETMDKYALDAEYCSISSTNFYRQYCVGGLAGNDAYPVLKFIDGTHLEMGKVQDIVVGVHVAVQLPLTEKIQFKPTLGYNYGTGAGGAGTLTSENNTKLWFRAEVPWAMTNHFLVKIHGDYSTRQATIKGKIGNNNDKWATDSTILGAGVDVGYVF